MIYGSSQGQSALGSLLRKMQEETLSNPARVPQAAGEASPIRAQIQGPIDAPEAVGSEKVVSMKPELNPSQETPSPVAPNNVVSPTPMGVSAAAAGSPTVVGPTNIQIPSSPSIENKITAPTSSKSPISTSTTSPINNNPTATPSFNLPSGGNLNVGSKQPATSLATKPLMPSAFNDKLKNVIANSGSIKQGYSTSNTQKAASAGGGVGASSLLSRLMLGLGTFISRSTLNKGIESMKYGGRKATKI